MIGTDYIQKALIVWLRTNAAVLSGVAGDTSKIKEGYYSAPTFTYPAIRIENILEEPIGDGTDRLKLSNISFEIVVFSEKDNSKEAMAICRIIGSNLFGLNNSIVGKDDNNVDFFRLIFTDYTRTPTPMKLTERLWRASVVFSARANLLNP